jgi:hypothetical protein
MTDSNFVSSLGNLVSNSGEALVINIPEYYMTSSGSHFKGYQPTQSTGATGNQRNFIGKVDHSVSFNFYSPLRQELLNKMDKIGLQRVFKTSCNTFVKLVVSLETANTLRGSIVDCYKCLTKFPIVL